MALPAMPYIIVNDYELTLHGTLYNINVAGQILIKLVLLLSTAFILHAYYYVL